MKNLLLIVLIINFYGCAFRNREKNLLPSFDLLLMDSTTVFNTSRIPEGRPIVLMYFSPDCEHCQKETEMILKNMSLFKNTRFYMITIDPMDRLRVYNRYYHMEKYANIILAKDYCYEFYNYFKPMGTPYFAIYDRRKELNTIYASGAPIDEFRDTICHLE